MSFSGGEQRRLRPQHAARAHLERAERAPLRPARARRELARSLRELDGVVAYGGLDLGEAVEAVGGLYEDVGGRGGGGEG